MALKGVANRAVALAVASAWCIAGAVAHAQDDEDITPLPAELMPLAQESLLLDVVNTGSRFVAVGERGHVVASLDGAGWVQANVPTRATLTAVSFASDQKGWAVGHDAAIIGTTDGGRNWTLQQFLPELQNPLLDVLFLDENQGYAVGAYSSFYRTYDGGDTWEEHPTPVREDEWHFNAITQLNDGTLIIVGEAGTIAVSSDRGESWTKVNAPYEGSYFGATPVGDSGVLIFGLRGNAFIADTVLPQAAEAPAEDSADAADAGDDADVDEADGTDTYEVTWNRVDTGTEQTLLGGDVLDGGASVIVGLNSTVLKIDGNRATPMSLGVDGSLNGVLAEGGKLLFVGDNGSQVANR